MDLLDLFLAYVGLIIALCVYLCIEIYLKDKAESKAMSEDAQRGTGGLEFPLDGLLKNLPRH